MHTKSMNPSLAQVFDLSWDLWFWFRYPHLPQALGSTFGRLLSLLKKSISFSSGPRKSTCQPHPPKSQFRPPPLPRVSNFAQLASSAGQIPGAPGLQKMIVQRNAGIDLGAAFSAQPKFHVPRCGIFSLPPGFCFVFCRN